MLHISYRPKRSSGASATVLGLLLIIVAPQITLAHAGHGNEFQHDSQPVQTVGAIEVDAATAERMGLTVESVSRQRLVSGIKTTGQIEAQPNQQAEVTTPVGGTVLRLLVKPGEQVRVGQPVAIMTSPELAELRTIALDRQSEALGSVQQAEADLRLAQQNYEQQQRIAQAEIQQAQVALNVAQEQYDRDRDLLSTGAIPRRTVLESESKLAEAKAAFAKVRSQLQVSEAQAQLKRAQSAVDVAQSKSQLSGQTYQTRLRQLGASANADGTITITAPISGVVADREATIGESGQDAGKKIMTIVNGSSVLIAADIYEKDLDKVQQGQGVQVRVNGLPNRMFRGRISVIGATVQGDTRVVPVKAELDNADGALKPGMFAELEVLTDRTPVAVLAVPKSAIVETNDKKKIVFVQNGQAFQPTEVSLGRESGEFVEVTNGLFDGDRVVTQRATQLYAQSLRTGGQKEANHSPNPVTSQSSMPLPWWAILPIGGLLIGSTFWAGMYWANRRQRFASPVPAESNGFHPNPEIDLNHFQSQNGKLPTEVTEKQFDRPQN
ncbi:MAG: efflux RND transporter periplasmic adaptor subunit [Leptolyngbya sp. UWPOB_LEPTO1]|uniref:efflux RND transporter periplasmic adaptor subunit n=1 Tax=Leptolyngbya sp. UWPOB_LEPTO1 TaxID=2815653 RepID=UPI001ACFF98F|nr:efflux RND transporter periplasmic adaptor subunit [Leptolyngbya sp. UWPOB_LEPTO1]MBN8561986.1 efflux RND transporter periplasmic adaptor subunit [Leptolyngbya sp. UWPOB_LEPTO1]